MKYSLLALAVLALLLPTRSQADSAAPGIVEFHIPAGTGTGPWNKPDQPAVVRVGQTLRIFNDDSVTHFLHTDGKPCPHGTRPFAPGEHYDCVVSIPYNESDEELYDHNYGPDAEFFVQANR